MEWGNCKEEEATVSLGCHHRSVHVRRIANGTTRFEDVALVEVRSGIQGSSACTHTGALVTRGQTQCRFEWPEIGEEVRDQFIRKIENKQSQEDRKTSLAANFLSRIRIRNYTRLWSIDDGRVMASAGKQADWSSLLSRSSVFIAVKTNRLT